jgi:hypothetical protein
MLFVVLNCIKGILLSLRGVWAQGLRATQNP